MWMMGSDWRSFAPWRRKHVHPKRVIFWIREFRRGAQVFREPNDLGPKDMIKFVASWTFISFVCSFGGGGGKDQRWCNCWYFERFVPNKNPGIVIVHDTCMVTAGYVDVDTLLQLEWWFTLGLLLGWKNIWIQLLGSPPHLLKLPSLKTNCKQFFGKISKPSWRIYCFQMCWIHQRWFSFRASETLRRWK